MLTRYRIGGKLSVRNGYPFGAIHVLEEADEKRYTLSNLLQKYFPQMTSGKKNQPITDEELKRTSVYVSRIESWSGIFEQLAGAG